MRKPPLHIVMALAVAGLCGFGGEASADKPSGITVAVITSASASGSTGSRTLNLNGPVFNGDRVDTNAGGEAQIRFRDNTRLVVGPNSSLIIDAFVFNPDDSVQKVSMQAVKGAFRFFSGTGPKQAYSIRTPSATIGIRGTRFDVLILRGGRTYLTSYEGKVDICAVTLDETKADAERRKKECVTVAGGCALVRADRDTGVHQVGKDTPERRALLPTFPYAVSQVGLRSDFRTNVSACGVETTQQPGTPGQPGPGAPGAPGAAPFTTAAAVGGAAALGAVAASEVNAGDDDEESPTGAPAAVAASLGLGLPAWRRRLWGGPDGSPPKGLRERSSPGVSARNARRETCSRSTR